jgi:hypothetical protein
MLGIFSAAKYGVDGIILNYPNINTIGLFPIIRSIDMPDSYVGLRCFLDLFRSAMFSALTCHRIYIFEILSGSS